MPDFPLSNGTAPLTPCMQDFVARAAATPAAVLLLGETGSGKTHLARLIHEGASSARRPFVRADCASLPDSIVERELFGHVRGAFTDARESRQGLVEAAAGGTLFLDEIGELPLPAQGKLLTLYDEGTFRRLGSPTEVEARARLIAATNRSLPTMCEEGRFRRDLYYRCAVLTFRVPPLRARRKQLAAIVAHLLVRLASRDLIPGCRLPRVGEDTLAALAAYRWPGNIRELEHALTQAVTFHPGGEIRPEHLPEAVRRPRSAEGGVAETPRRYAAPATAAEERAAIVAALEAERGNKTRAARRLGMSRQTLRVKLLTHGLRAGLPAGVGEVG